MNNHKHQWSKPNKPWKKEWYCQCGASCTDQELKDECERLENTPITFGIDAIEGLEERLLAIEMALYKVLAASNKKI